MTGARYAEERLCFVNCGMPGDQCACYRAAMSKVHSDLVANQKPLGADFQKIWEDNIGELYVS